jgi:membrane fusion protein, multidrug efflux system
MSRLALARAHRVAILGIGLIGCALAFGTTKRGIDAPVPPPVAAPVPVVLAQVAKEEVPEYADGIGNVQAGASVTVRARVDGQLERLLFEEGQDVAEGQVVAEIDPRALRAQLGQARAQRARDEALLENARADLSRYEGLSSKDSVSRQTLNTQRAQVAQLEAVVENDRAQVELAEVQLSYATIRSPIAGRTGMRLTDAGNLVRAAEATGIVVVNRIDPVYLLFSLPEGDLARVREAERRAGGEALKVLALGREDEELLGEGKLLLVNNQIDANSGTVQLKAAIPNATHRLWPGQYVNARLVLGADRNALVVPAAAVQRGPKGPFVYVVDGERKAELRPVELTRLQAGKAVVRSGLAAGEHVVVVGQSKLRPGARIVEAGESSRRPSGARDPGKSG